MQVALEEDPEALEVLRLIAERAGDARPGPAIQRELGISEKEFRARVTRMRRALYKRFPAGI